MNTIGTQVLMAGGISRRRFLVNSTGIAIVAGLPLVQSRLRKGRHAWIQLIEGDLDCIGNKLLPGDGAAIDEEKKLNLASGKGAHLLLFDRQ
jgi:hypothetical protein